MGNKHARDKKKAAKEIRPPKVVVKVTSLVGDPAIEQIEDRKHVVLWMDVQGHGRIKVESASPGVYHASAVDPGAASAAEAGAGAYCEQHGDLLRQLYGQLLL